MISLKHISIDNFMKIEHLNMDFCDNTIIAITGQNGGGKSTLLTALAFCLTSYRKGEKAQDYIRLGEEEAHIHLDALFNNEPITYDVTIAESASKTRKQVTYRDITYINSDYNQFVSDNKLDDLESLMFMFQGSMDLINMKPAARAESLKSLFNFNLDSRIDYLNNEYEKSKNLEVESNARLNELRSREFAKMPLLREMPQDVIDGLEEELKDMDKKLEELGEVDITRLKEAKRELGRIKEEKDIAESSITAQKRSLDDYKLKLDKSNEQLKAMPSKDYFETEREEISEALKAHKEQYKVKTKKYMELNEEKRVLNFQLKEKLEQIKISQSGVCHACGHSIEPSHIERLENNRKELSLRIADTEVALKELDYDTNDAISKEYEANIRKIDFEISNRHNLENDIANLELRVSNMESRIEASLATIDKCEPRIDSLKKEILNLESLECLSSQREETLDKRNELNNRIKLAKEAIIKNEERRIFNEKADKEAVERDTKVNELAVKVNEYTLDTSSIKDAKTVLEKGFMNYLVINACNMISEYINSIVQRVFPYMKVALTQTRGGINFLYTPNNESDKYLSVAMASGAERQILSLAYKVALAKYYRIQCLCLDEIDASCTDDNAGVIYQFIATLDDFPQIIFISHRHDALQAIMDSDRKNIIAYYVSNGEYEPQ